MTFVRKKSEYCIVGQGVMRGKLEISRVQRVDHFVDVNKIVELRKGAQREVDDMMLTRYAC